MKAKIPVCYRTKCEKCATKIEFQLSETHRLDYKGGRYITCPGCKNEITVLCGTYVGEEGPLAYPIEAVYAEDGEVES